MVKQPSKVHWITYNEFENSLTSSMIVYIERNTATSFSFDSSIEDFKTFKEFRGSLWLKVIFDI